MFLTISLFAVFQLTAHDLQCTLNCWINKFKWFSSIEIWLQNKHNTAHDLFQNYCVFCTRIFELFAKKFQTSFVCFVQASFYENNNKISAISLQLAIAFCSFISTTNRWHNHVQRMNVLCQFMMYGLWKNKLKFLFCFAIFGVFASDCRKMVLDFFCVSRFLELVFPIAENRRVFVVYYNRFLHFDTCDFQTAIFSILLFFAVSKVFWTQNCKKIQFCRYRVFFVTKKKLSSFSLAIFVNKSVSIAEKSLSSLFSLAIFWNKNVSNRRKKSLDFFSVLRFYGNCNSNSREWTWISPSFRNFMEFILFQLQTMTGIYCFVMEFQSPKIAWFSLFVLRFCGIFCFQSQTMCFNFFFRGNFSFPFAKKESVLASIFVQLRFHRSGSSSS